MKRKQRRLITIDELINQQPQKGKTDFEEIARELAEKYPAEFSFGYLKGVAIIDDTDNGGAL